MEVDLKMKTKCNYQSENRLTALSQNGYVSHNWYDADGERTVAETYYFLLPL